MSFKSFGEGTRPDRVKTVSTSSPTSAFPNPTPSTTSRCHASNTSVSSHASSDNGDAVFHDARFSPEEEATMITSSHTIKADANKQFSNSDFESAIGTYDKALAELPSYLDYETAVLQSNIAACHVRLEQWKEAVKAAEMGLEGLEREMPTKEGRKMKVKTKMRGARKGGNKNTARRKGLESDSEDEPEPKKPEPVDAQTNGQVVELPSDAEDDELEQKLKELNISDSRKRDITRIRTKLLLRRARARSSIDPPSWANLGGALEDYQVLSQPEYLSTLPSSDQKTVRMALVSLPPRVKEAQQKEMGEMMGKLKELGNGLLKPFGLSTDMFKMTQGADGGWSMNVGGGEDKKA